MPRKEYWEPSNDAPKPAKPKPPDPPFAHPHMCETESVAAAIARLSAQKRRVLRSYVWNVELGSKRVGQWLADKQCPVSPAAWYRQGGKNYLNDDAFVFALTTYVERALAWQSQAEAVAVQQAAHKLRLHSLAAVEGLIEIMADGESDAVRVRAMNSILDRADVETAVKSSQEVTGADGGPVQIYLPDNARDSEGVSDDDDGGEA